MATQRHRRALVEEWDRFLTAMGINTALLLARIEPIRVPPPPPPAPQRSWPAVTPRQQRLLFNLVDWERADDSELIFIEVLGGSFINGHDEIPVERSDLEQIAVKSYLHLREPAGTLFVSVTAEGTCLLRGPPTRTAPA